MKLLIANDNLSTGVNNGTNMFHNTNEHHSNSLPHLVTLQTHGYG